MSDKKHYDINFTSITDDEKKELKIRIFNSVFSYKRMKYRTRYRVAIAASIAIVVSISINHYFNQNSSINSFVKQSDKVDINETNKVKLILNDSKKIDIINDSSTITYSKSGEKINIGNLNEIDQTIEKNKIAYNTLIVPYGRRSQIKLSDGSKVWLNSGSKLVYPQNFKNDKREVYLEGEGIFEVTHNKNKPFIVLGIDHEIEVLGTVFNINNYSDENDVSTVLKSGSIQIHYKGNSFFKSNETIKIKPGTVATYSKSDHVIITEITDIDKYFSWREGLLIFKNDELSSIMKKLSRYYNVNIIIKNKELEKEKFSGYLDLKENVENVIELVQETANFEFNKTSNNEIIIN